jgi:hypothetical protein
MAIMTKANWLLLGLLGATVWVFKKRIEDLYARNTFDHTLLTKAPPQPWKWMPV